MSPNATLSHRKDHSRPSPDEMKEVLHAKSPNSEVFKAPEFRTGVQKITVRITVDNSKQKTIPSSERSNHEEERKCSHSISTVAPCGGQRPPCLSRPVAVPANPLCYYTAKGTTQA